MDIVRNFVRKYLRILTGDEFYCGCIFGCIAFHITQCTQYVSGTDISQLLNRLELLLSVILSVRFILIPKKNIYNLAWLGCCSFLFVSYRVGDNRTLLDTFVLVTSAYGTNFKKLVVTAKCAWISVSALIIMKPLSEVISLVYEIEGNISANEYSLGFLNNNTAGMVFFSVGLCLFAASYYKLKWLHIGGLFLVLLLCYYLTKSRTSSIGLIVLLFFAVIVKSPFGRWLRKSLKYKWVVIMQSSFGILVSAFALGVAVYYDKSSAFMTGLNELVHNRLHNASLYYQAFDILLWGQEIPDRLNGVDHYLDNGYLYILLNSGLIASLIMLGLWTWSLYAAWKRRNVAVGVGISVLMVLLMMERQVALCHICWLLSYGFASVHPRGRGSGKVIEEASGKISEDTTVAVSESSGEATGESGGEPDSSVTYYFVDSESEFGESGKEGDES